MREQQTVREFLDSVSVGEPLSFKQLALYPLYRKEAAPFLCITLDEAMAKGSFQVKEVDGGTVPLLLVVNGTGELKVHESLREVLGESKVASLTAALEDVFEKKRATLDGYASALACPKDAVGVAAVIAGRFVCADLFACAGMLASLWKKLVQSYALDAPLAPAGDGKLPTAGQVMTAMRLPEDALVETFESPGLGESARIRTPLLTGSALVLEPAVVHLELFAAQGGEARQGSSRLSRPSRRAQP